MIMRRPGRSAVRKELYRAACLGHAVSTIEASERLVVVIADQVVELGAGLHLVQHALGPAVTLQRRVEAACALLAT